MRQARAFLTAVLVCLCLPTCLFLPTLAGARQPVSFRASLTPERLGKATTVGLDLRILAPGQQAPPVLTRVDVSYPLNLGFGLSELGLETCLQGTLEARGPAGCPVNSLVGYGTAFTELVLGPTVLHEHAKITIIRAPQQDGRLSLLFYAIGQAPTIAQLVLPSLLLPAPAPFGGHMRIEVPRIHSLPSAPDVSILQLRLTLGPPHLTYRERVHGHTVYFEPRGIPLPKSCPHGGFHFSALFSFAGGEQTRAKSLVPCPQTGSGR